MTVEVFAEALGQAVRKYRLRLPSREWLIALLLGLNALCLAMLIWMYRYDISGPGLVLDRLSQTIYTCNNGRHIGDPSRCYQLYPPQYSYSQDGTQLR